MTKKSVLPVAGINEHFDINAENYNYIVHKVKNCPPQIDFNF